MNAAHKKRIICIYTAAVLALLAATIWYYSSESDEERYIEEWYHRTLTFPDSLSFYRWGEEPQEYDFSSSEYKVLALLDTMACISCQLRLDDWKRFMADMDTVTNKKISYVFMMRPILKSELSDVLREENFDIPVCLNDRQFRQINRIPATGSHVFLLDHSNKIICIGSPVLHYKITKLYKQLIK